MLIFLVIILCIMFFFFLLLSVFMFTKDYFTRPNKQKMVRHCIWIRETYLDLRGWLYMQLFSNIFFHFSFFSFSFEIDKLSGRKINERLAEFQKLYTCIYICIYIRLPSAQFADLIENIEISLWYLFELLKIHFGFRFIQSIFKFLFCSSISKKKISFNGIIYGPWL